MFCQLCIDRDTCFSAHLRPLLRQRHISEKTPLTLALWGAYIHRLTGAQRPAAKPHTGGRANHSGCIFKTPQNLYLICLKA